MPAKKPNATLFEARVQFELQGKPEQRDGHVEVKGRTLRWSPNTDRHAPVVIDVITSLESLQPNKDVKKDGSKAKSCLKVKWNEQHRTKSLILQFKEKGHRDDVLEHITSIISTAQRQGHTPKPIQPRPNPSLTGEDRAKHHLLTSDPHLRAVHKSLVLEKVISEEDFWAERKDLLNHALTAVALQPTGMQSRHYIAQVNEILTAQKGEDGMLEIQLDNALTNDILRTEPGIERAFNNNVPHKMSPEAFWKAWLNSGYFNPTARADDDDIFSHAEKEIAREASKAGGNAPAPSSDPSRELLSNFSEREGGGFEEGYGLRYLSSAAAPRGHPTNVESSVETQESQKASKKAKQVLQTIARFNRHSNKVVGQMVDLQKAKPDKPGSSDPGAPPPAASAGDGEPGPEESKLDAIHGRKEWKSYHLELHSHSRLDDLEGDAAEGDGTSAAMLPLQADPTRQMAGIDGENMEDGAPPAKRQRRSAQSFSDLCTSFSQEAEKCLSQDDSGMRRGLMENPDGAHEFLKKFEFRDRTQPGQSGRIGRAFCGRSWAGNPHIKKEDAGSKEFDEHLELFTAQTHEVLKHFWAQYFAKDGMPRPLGGADEEKEARVMNCISELQKQIYETKKDCRPNTKQARGVPLEVLLDSLQAAKSYKEKLLPAQ